MCGIAGGTGDPDVQREVVDRQLRTLLHRGPDALGFAVGAVATIGQTRLAVMDPPGGDPPLTDESGEIRVALNGEIYNFRKIMAELESTGHRFRSRCDTEVLAHLGESLEPTDLARRLHGMFAFAIWDNRRRRLVLGRDRVGKKPLYYWTNGPDLVFGSEIKAVLADPRVPREIDLGVVPAYLAFGYAPSPQTFYRDIVALPPGCVLIWDDGEMRVHSYWDSTPSADALRATSHAELADETRAILTQAVRERMDADVPLGAFLSGGLDSSSIVALMSEATSRPIQTFCIGFEEAEYDERKWARVVAERFGTEHVEEVVRPDASALIDEVLFACDQPFADSSALPTYLLAAVTRKTLTVALSGDGGDEVFGGYERFAAGSLFARAQSAPTWARKLAHAAGTRLSSPDARDVRGRAGRFLRLLDVPMPQAYEDLVRLFDDEWLAASGLQPQAERFNDIWTSTEGAQVVSRLLDLNRRTYLVDDLLVKADRMSMAHGLEVRSPFLDHRLIEFSNRIPCSRHVRGRQLKRLLRAAMKDTLPAEILRRPKRGFGVPLDRWFRRELRAELESRLLTPKARINRVVDAERVAQLFSDHDSGRAAHGQRLWALLMLERFLERQDW